MRVLVLWADDRSPNLGVRALGAGHTALVRSLWPEAEVVLHNYGSRATPVPMGSVRGAVKELLTGRGGVVKWLAGFDLVIDTRSGDSFSDLYGMERHEVMTALAEAVRRSGTPMVYGPQTYGPFASRAATMLAKWSLRSADLVLARDHVSGQVLADIGRPADLITTDVVFALPRPEAPGPRRDVVVNVSGLLWHGEAGIDAADYRRIVLDLLHRLDAEGREITLLAHVLSGSSTDSDVAVLDDVVRAVGLDLPTVVPDSLWDARQVLAGANLTIGSRMHACLNSLSVGVPAIPLAYSRKFAPLLSDIGWKYTVGLQHDDPVGRVLALAADPEMATALPQTLRAAQAKVAQAADALAAVVAAPVKASL